MLDDSLLYHKSEDFKALLDFTVKLRNVAPFNAMLLHLQRPGIQYVASKHDWRKYHKRAIKDGARPLLILVPFGPVAFVYDVHDTEGKPLPKHIENPFPATGNVKEDDIEHCLPPWIPGKRHSAASGTALTNGGVLAVTLCCLISKRPRMSTI